MFKALFLSLTILLSLPVAAQNPPQIIDKVWYLSGMNDEVVVYADLTSLSEEKDIGATSVWVKIFDKVHNHIILAKWAYRNGGDESCTMSSASYTKGMKLISAYTVPRYSLNWQMVIPESLSAGVRKACQDWIKYVKDHPNTPAATI